MFEADFEEMAKKKSITPKPAKIDKKVAFNEPTTASVPHTSGGLKPSPSLNTLNRLERETIVLWRKPFLTFYYAIMELLHLFIEFIVRLFDHKLLLFLFTIVASGFSYAYVTPGPHQVHIQSVEKTVLWWGWWVFLGVLSSVGLGSGLHTAPHIAAVTLAAYECGTLDFPEPPYPSSIVCPEKTTRRAVTLWQIVSKVRIESLLWGAGTALGELPPYFMARAARLGGQQPDDEEYREFLAHMNAERGGNSEELSFMDRCKAKMEKFIARVGFPGILLFASIPNPLFDLAGITCGHFLVPFWSFFSARRFSEKALVKMHVQMLFVIIAFSEHHAEHVVDLLEKIPVVGSHIRKPMLELLTKQKNALHRTPGTHVEQSSSTLQVALSMIVSLMIFGFLMSIVNSLAQGYHKRLYDRTKKLKNSINIISFPLELFNFPSNIEAHLFNHSMPTMASKDVRMIFDVVRSFGSLLNAWLPFVFLGSSSEFDGTTSSTLLTTLLELVTVDKSDERLKRLIAKEILPQTQNWEATEEFLNRIVEVLLKYIRDENDRDQKILEFHHPDKMQMLIDLSIPEKPENLLSLVKSCETVLSLGVRTGHPRFFNQISCGFGPGFDGRRVAHRHGQHKYVYLRNSAAIGWDVDKADGIFAPGGSIANLYAMNAARHHLHPRSKHLGMKDIPTLCAFTSEDSHYSIKTAAAVCGIGTDYCFNIPTDRHGKMIPEALERKIIEAKKDGLTPFFVCCTAGTTVYGAFDPIERVADICETHKLWLHVDAAWGGGLLLSPEHRYRLAGIERVNSVTWNPHKMMGALLQCSACLFRQDGLLFQCNQMSADYLFQQDKPYDVSFDTGDKAIQCGRHNDVFKLWLMWKSKGMEGYRQQINRLMDLTYYFTKRIKETEGFELIIEKPELLNICFWYVPSKIRNLDAAERTARLEKIAPKIKAEMMVRGTTMVGYQPDKQRPNFFRMIISNQAITHDDLDFLIKEIVDIGESL
ncbi:unnamed protein product [Caenorhabditis auriculariae]|uniref:Uncharacterized protein n=1 Tax=Caenorhabditis auriculariae TaxID=2777116 RepID=A0A8S1HT85_9PELO|nr:unnamed protein product [Caenorhabditis auriculariae]